MANWREFVRQRLAALALDADEREDVHAELAAHLEESCEELQAEGLPEREAVQRTIAQVPDWQDFGHKIAFAKRGEDLMEKRIRQLWIPGFLALILSALSQMTLQKLGFQPRLVWSGPNTILLYVPWLLSLPFFGALGAYVSSRAGGSRGTVLLASVFPVLALATAFLLMFPIGLAVERITGKNEVDFRMVATALLRDEIGWILVPGAALLAGGFLSQLFLSRRLDSRRLVGH
jgi:hypothetical protein